MAGRAAVWCRGWPRPLASLAGGWCTTAATYACQPIQAWHRHCLVGVWGAMSQLSHDLLSFFREWTTQRTWFLGSTYCTVYNTANFQFHICNKSAKETVNQDPIYSTWRLIDENNIESCDIVQYSTFKVGSENVGYNSIKMSSILSNPQIQMQVIQNCKDILYYCICFAAGWVK